MGSERQGRRRAVTLGAGLLVPALLAGAAQAAGPTATTLENGLRVCIAEDYGSDTVAVAMLVHATADCEPDEKAGLRLVLQHALQAALDDRLRAEPDLGGLSDARDSGGGVQFNSEWEYVWLGYEGVADMLAEALPALADALFRPRIAESHLQAAQGQVLPAVAGPASAPAASTIGLFRLALLGRPARAYPLGTAETVQALSVADLNAFHRRFYVPALSSVAIVGPVDTKQTMQLVTRSFGDLPKGDSTLAPPPDVLARSSARVASNVELSLGDERHMDIASIVVGVPAPGLGDPDEATTHIMHALVGGVGRDGGRIDRDDRLWEALGFPFPKEEARRRNFVESIPPPISRRSHIAIHAYTAPRQAEAAREALLSQFESLAAREPEASELAAAKAYVSGALAASYDLPANRALLMGRACLLDEADPTGRTLIRQVTEASARDVQRVAKAWFGAHAAALELPEP